MILSNFFRSGKKIAITGGLIILVILFVACMWLKGDIKKDRAALLKIMSKNVDLQIRDVHYTEVGDPDSIWEINADTAKYVKKDNVVFFENIRVKLIMSGGKTYVMTGDEGRLRTDTKNIKICGDVEVVSDKGDRFSTDYLDYYSSDKRVYTDGRITMKNPQMEVSGIGMSLSLKTEKVTLLSAVRTLIK